MCQALPALIPVGLSFLKELGRFKPPSRHPFHLSLAEALTASPGEPVASVELLSLPCKKNTTSTIAYRARA